MKNINVKVPDDILEDLKYIQAYYSLKLEISLNQRETIMKLIHESSNTIRHTGEIYPNRNWDYEKNESQIHTEYFEKLKKGESNKSK